MIKPLPGFVLVEAIEEENKSAGGVYLSDSAKDKPSKGKIIEVGKPTLEEIKLLAEHKYVFGEEFKKGDIVIYKKWTNQEVQHEGKEYLLVAFNELLAVIE